MASWKLIAVDRLIAKLTGGKIGVESKTYYTNTYGTVDFTSDDDIPNLRAIKALIGPAGGEPVELNVYAAGSAVPYFLDIGDYDGFSEYATLLCRCPEIGKGTVTTTASGTTVTGTGTNFTTQFQVGQQITVNGETHTISAITDDTHLTTDAWTGANSGLGYTTGNFIRYNDIEVREVWIGAVFAGWNVYGHTNDGVTTSEDLYITIKP